MAYRSRVLVAATSVMFLASVIFALGSAAAEPGGDAHYFTARVVGTGSTMADFGEERKQPYSRAADSGVDGKESLSWRWEVQAVAKSVGAGPLITRAHVERARAVLAVSVVSWGIQNFVLTETPVCADRQGATTVVSNDGRGWAARKAGFGEYVHGQGDFRVANGGLGVRGPRLVTPMACFHGSPHDLGLVWGTGSDEARVPRGAFNPRSDRSYRKTYTDSDSKDRSHGGDPNSAHTFTGNSKVELQIDAISARRFNRLVKKYQHVPVGLPGSGETAYHEPPLTSP
jgi:hypothetical protein